MFGLFNKKPDQKTQLQQILFKITLLQSWSLDVRNKDYSAEDLFEISRKIASSIDCKNENIIQGAVMMALTDLDLEKGRALRRKVNFDVDAISVCKGLKLDPAHYQS